MGEFDWVPVHGVEGPALFQARLVSHYHGDLGVVPIMSVSAKGIEFDDGGSLHLPWSAVDSLQAISGAEPRCWLCDTVIGVGFTFCSECYDGDPDDLDGVWPADGEVGVLRWRLAQAEAKLAALQAVAVLPFAEPAPAPNPIHWCPECGVVRVVDPSLSCDSCAGGAGPEGPRDPGICWACGCTLPASGVCPVCESVAAGGRRSWRSRSASPAWRRASLAWRVDGPVGVRRVAL